MPAEALRLPHPLDQWGWGFGRAEPAPSAEWTLARSLVGCAGQEHPSLAGKMLTLCRTCGELEFCQLELGPAGTWAVGETKAGVGVSWRAARKESQRGP